MITKLADKWRKGKFPAKVPDGGYGFCSGKRHCADELESALPKWTRIIEDDLSTYPPENGYFMIADQYNGNWESFTTDHLDDECNPWWRPLCDLDYPPETEI